VKYLALLLLIACGKSSKPANPLATDATIAKAVDADTAPVIDAPPPKPIATKVVVGVHASCAVMSDHTLRCWGANDKGQLGDGTTSDHPTPVTPNIVGVQDVVLGAAHACALLDDGSVTCWGDIGFGKGDHQLLPAGVPGVNDAKRLFAVGAASCATMSNGAFVCWGNIDPQGHLRLSGGTREHRVPTPGKGLSTIAALTETGALRDDGTVYTWGADGVPTLSALTDITEIAAAGDSVCGLTKTGEVACAGGTPHCATKPVAKPPVKKAKPKHGKKAKPVKVEEPPPAIEKLALPAGRHLAFDVGLCVVTTTGRLQCLAANNPCELDEPWPGLAKVDTVDGHCARSVEGQVRCWQVDRKSRTVTLISGVTGAVQMASSSSHGCALLGDHQVVCWGENTHGELGRGVTDTTNHPEAAPVKL
jgi:hypothetical protein